MAGRKWLLLGFSLVVYGTTLVAEALVTPSRLAVQRHKASRCSTSLTATNTDTSNDRTLGLAVLLTVPLAWGTYTPVVKGLYALNPPVPGFVFSAAYYAIAAVTLWVLVVGTTNNKDFDATRDTSTTTTSLQLQGGLELGGYLFLGNALQVLGLQTVPADRAGFLVQLTTVLVPLLEAFTQQRAVPSSTWAACLLAMGGVVVMEDFRGGSDSTLFTGDGFILLAALVYSLHVVRLSTYATQIPPLVLAASKATVEAILSIGLVVGLVFLGSSSSTADVGFVTTTGGEIVTFLHAFSTQLQTSGLTPDLYPALGAVFWTGWITCAYTIFAQSFGQRRVAATEANLIYTVQPLCTALVAYLLLGETLGPSGILGGAMISAAVYSVAVRTD